MIKDKDEKVIDEYGRTAKDVYNDLESEFKIPKDFGNTQDEAELNQAMHYFWEDDANELLANIGLEQDFDITKYPRDQLFRIFRYYHADSEKINQDGKVEYNDPLPYYKVGDGTPEDELYKFGYELGKTGEIGIYYRLLPNINFRYGYWTGKFERAVELNDDTLILDVGKEIRIYDAEKAEQELTNIVNNIFVEKSSNKQR